MITLDVSAEGISDIIQTLEPTPKQVERALKRTLARMSKWLSVRSTKGLSNELALSQKIIRRRLKNTNVVAAGGGYSIRLWHGLNDISLIHLNPRQNKTGVTASKRKVAGAFISRSKNQVFKRSGKSRLPLEKQVDVIKSKADAFIESGVFDAREFEEMFLKNLEHEIKWLMR